MPLCTPPKGALKIWHIPQVPMKPFEIAVATPQEGRKILDVLSSYDLFQLEHNIKPDYTNASGLSIYDGNEWIDWCDASGNSIDDTEDFITDPSMRG